MLVTGASGFLGDHLCRLLLAEGYSVRALLRKNSTAPARDIIRHRVSDLSDRAGLRGALDGVDSVIHLAARVHVMDDRTADPLTAFRRVNVEGTRVLLEEAVAAGVQKFLFISSVKTMGEKNSGPWNQNTPPDPVDAYGISKLEAENLVRQTARQHGVQALIFRFPLIYGPGMKGNMLQLFRWVDRGIPLPLGHINNRRSLLYAENAVHAIISGLEFSISDCETFLVSDGRPTSTPDLIREIARALGRPARLFSLPLPLLRTAARIGDWINTTIASPITTASLDRVVGSLMVDSSRFRCIAGHAPPYSISEGMDRTASWYRTLQR